MSVSFIIYSTSYLTLTFDSYMKIDRKWMHVKRGNYLLTASDFTCSLFFISLYLCVWRVSFYFILSLLAVLNTTFNYLRDNHICLLFFILSSSFPFKFTFLLNKCYHVFFSSSQFTSTRGLYLVVLPCWIFFKWGLKIKLIACAIFPQRRNERKHKIDRSSLPKFAALRGVKCLVVEFCLSFWGKS